MRVFGFNIDPTPGFNLGITDGWHKTTQAGNSFKGASGNKVSFSNPTGQPAPQKTAPSGVAGTSGTTVGPEPVTAPSTVETTSQGSSAPAVNPADLAFIDSGIDTTKNSIGLLDRQEQVGMDNINQGYLRSYQRLLNDKAIADRNYNTSKTQATADNVRARNDVKTNVGRTANSVQRLLGMHGAGDSSAAKIVAPYGAALEGTQQLRSITDAFGRNMQALDTEKGDYDRNWTASNTDLGEQKYKNENSLRSDIKTKRASLLSTLANLTAQRSAATGAGSAGAAAAARPYIDEANTIAADIVELGRQYANPINVTTPTYTAPELAKYDVEGAHAPTVDNTSAYTDTISPYLATLLGIRRKQNNVVA